MLKYREIDQKKLIRLSIITLVVFLSVFIFFKLVKFILPFVLAFLIASLLRPLCRFLTKKLKIKNGLVSLLLVIIFYGVVGTLIILILIAAINQAISAVNNFPNWINQITPALENLFNDIKNIVSDLDDRLPSVSLSISQNLQEINNAIISSASSLAKTLGQKILDTAISLPSVLLFIVFMIISTFFIVKDRNLFKTSITKQFPYKWLVVFSKRRKSISHVLLKWVRAQSTILSITFLEVLIGLSIIGIRYSLLLALIIAVIDILPVLGTGTILIPWVIISFLLGNTSLALKLLILYVTITVIRQLIEPKIVGREIGIHPLITLFFMYIGVHLFGVLGFLIGPIYIMICKNLMMGILAGNTIEDYISKNPIGKKTES